MWEDSFPFSSYSDLEGPLQHPRPMAVHATSKAATRKRGVGRIQSGESAEMMTNDDSGRTGSLDGMGVPPTVARHHRHYKMAIVDKDLECIHDRTERAKVGGIARKCFSIVKEKTPIEDLRVSCDDISTEIRFIWIPPINEGLLNGYANDIISTHDDALGIISSCFVYSNIERSEMVINIPRSSDVDLLVSSAILEGIKETKGTRTEANNKKRRLLL